MFERYSLKDSVVPSFCLTLFLSISVGRPALKEWPYIGGVL